MTSSGNRNKPLPVSPTKIFLYFIYTEIYFLLYGFQTQVFKRGIIYFILWIKIAFVSEASCRTHSMISYGYHKSKILYAQKNLFQNVSWRIILQAEQHNILALTHTNITHEKYSIFKLFLEFNENNGSFSRETGVCNRRSETVSNRVVRNPEAASISCFSCGPFLQYYSVLEPLLLSAMAVLCVSKWRIVAVLCLNMNFLQLAANVPDTGSIIACSHTKPKSNLT
jgi:hypothetical protein